VQDFPGSLFQSCPFEHVGIDMFFKMVLLIQIVYELPDFVLEEQQLKNQCWTTGYISFLQVFNN
jgi:hypothetical protein